MLEQFVDCAREKMSETPTVHKDKTHTDTHVHTHTHIQTQAQAQTHTYTQEGRNTQLEWIFTEAHTLCHGVRVCITHPCVAIDTANLACQIAEWVPLGTAPLMCGSAYTHTERETHIHTVHQHTTRHTHTKRKHTNIHMHTIENNTRDRSP